MNRFGLLELIGNTPVVKLDEVFPKEKYDFELYAKMECLNPGGSTKDRSAASMLLSAYKDGIINRNTVVIESSSGNFGIALAQLCKLLKLRLVCVIDPKTTEQNIKLLRAYGAELEYVYQPDNTTGEYLQARLNRVKELLKKIPNSYWTNQYANPYNPLGHKNTAKELFDELGDLDYIFVAVSTCGTARGYSDYIKENKLHTNVIAVDAEGSVIFGGKRADRLIPGHGAAVLPELYQQGIVDECVHVSDMDCIIGCHRLLDTEGIFAGGSTGAIISAIKVFSPKIEKGARCAFIVHDRGERYLDTIYSEKWVEEHFCIQAYR